MKQAKNYVLFLICTLLSQVGCNTVSQNIKSGSLELTSESNVAEDPQKKEKMQFLRLKNGLKVLLIQDEQADNSGAALAVSAGSAADTTKQLGLAHYLEHMLFINTQKYPEVDGFFSFLSQNGGFSNAFTDDDKTCYFFKSKPDALPEALDRFAQFFVSPTLDPSYSEKEKNAVNAEYSSKFEDDTWRKSHILKAMFAPSHPLAHFNIGNTETLKNIAPEDSKKFMERFYSADQMSLVVVSPKPIEEVKELIKSFADIPVRSTDKIEFPPLIEANTSGFRTLFYKPVKEARELLIYFNTIDTHTHITAKPLDLLFSMIDNEGRESLQELLKRKGYAERLGAGNWIEVEATGMGVISIKLTPLGLTRYQEVLKTIFEYLDFLRKQGLPKTYFQEQSLLAKLEYRFRESQDPTNRALQLSLQLHNLPGTDIEEKLATIEDYKPELFAEQLKLMTPEQSIAMVVTPEPPIQLDQQEPYFKAAYAFKQDEDLLKYLNSEPTEQFNPLPANPYIAEKFDNLKDEQWDAQKEKHPALLVNTRTEQLIWSVDRKFNNSKTHLALELMRPDNSLSLAEQTRHDLIDQLLLASLHHSLETEIYPLGLAGNVLGLFSTPLGIKITADGFQDKLETVLKKYLLLYKNAILKKEHFELAFTELQRNLNNFDLGAPMSQIQAFTGFFFLKQETHPQIAQQIITQIKFEDVLKRHQNIFNESFIRASIHGQMSRQQAIDLISWVRQNFSPNKIEFAQTVTPKYRLLPEKNRFLKVIPSTIHDSGLFYSVQLGEQDQASKAALMVISTLWESEAFKNLRTEKQLGYIVFGKSRNWNQVLTFNLYIQSQKYLPDAVFQEIKQFQTYFKNLITHMKKEQLENIKKSMINQILEQPKTLSEANEDLFYAAFERDFHFEYRQKYAQIIAQLSLEEITEKGLNKLFSPTNPALMVYVQGKNQKDFKTANFWPEKTIFDNKPSLEKPASLGKWLTKNLKIMNGD